jgi:hypothetical protein
VKYWEIIADKLSKAGWSLGWVSALDCQGQRSELLTRSATPEGALLCTFDEIESFLNLNDHATLASFSAEGRK